MRLLRAARPLHGGRHARGVAAPSLRRIPIGHGLLLHGLLGWHALWLPRLQWLLRLLLRLLHWDLLLPLLLRAWLPRLGLGRGAHHTPGNALQSMLQRRRVGILLLRMRCAIDQLSNASTPACTVPSHAKGTFFV